MMTSIVRETAPLKTSAPLAERILLFDAWLETMRGGDGYGGPIAHWWENCLEYTGAGLDWRYEGVILAYINLYDTTGDKVWLGKARRAADDLVRGQMPNGLYRNSQFELNPYPGGNPHEAACDIGLLSLAAALKAENDPTWSGYAEAATKNLHEFYIGWLWDEAAGVFFDNSSKTSLVANKCATVCEAIFKHADLSGDDGLVQQYGLPTLEKVLKLQIQAGELRGAICQSSMAGQHVEWYFPYYIARCVSGLMAAYEWTQDGRYLEAGRLATDFIMRWQYEDGSFPQIIYTPNKINRYPQWIAGAADILRVLEQMNKVGNTDYDLQPTRDWLFSGQDISGAFRTAYGFASHMTQREPRQLPEFRDVLPVVGWGDKTFRYMTMQLEAGSRLASDLSLQPFESECMVRGQVALYYEDAVEIRLQRKQKVLYCWRKGEDWAAICGPELLWK